MRLASATTSGGFRLLMQEEIFWCRDLHTESNRSWISVVQKALELCFFSGIEIISLGTLAQQQVLSMEKLSFPLYYQW